MRILRTPRNCLIVLGVTLPIWLPLLGIQLLAQGIAWSAERANDRFGDLIMHVVESDAEYRARARARVQKAGGGL